MKEESFIQQISEHQGIIHKICSIYTDHEEDHKDLFQEILYQLWTSYGSFNRKAKFTTWIYKVALYTAISGLRKEMVRKKHMEEYQTIGTDPDTNQVTEVNGDKLLSACMEQLSGADKAVMVLYLEEMSYSEMAQILGISENYVGVKINRIKSKLKEIYKTLEHERGF